MHLMQNQLRNSLDPVCNDRCTVIELHRLLNSFPIFRQNTSMIRIPSTSELNLPNVKQNWCRAYMRNTMHRVLYQQANSLAVNGLGGKEMKFEVATPVYRIAPWILMGLLAVCLICSILKMIQYGRMTEAEFTDSREYTKKARAIKDIILLMILMALVIVFFEVCFPSAAESLPDVTFLSVFCYNVTIKMLDLVREPRAKILDLVQTQCCCPERMHKEGLQIQTKDSEKIGHNKKIRSNPCKSIGLGVFFFLVSKLPLAI